MTDIKEQFNALRQSFMQMPLPTRVIGGSMLVVIAIGLWMLASGNGRGASTERLFIGESLTDDEITKVLAAFSAARLNGWDVKFNHIYVPTAARDEYLRAVQEAGALPLHEASLISAAHQQSGPLDSDSKRRAVEDHAKEQEIGRKIAEFDSILRATVLHDALKKGFHSDFRQSASVIVTPRGSDPLPEAMIRAIKELVKASYAGMSPDDVTVTDVNARGVTSTEDEDDLFQERVRWEEYLTRKARQHLKAFGPLSIAATVEINPTMDVEKARLAYDAQPTTVQEQSASTNIETNRPVGGGVPGVAPNAYGNQAAAIDPNQVRTDRTTKKSEATVKVTGEEYESSRLAGFQPERMSFSIGVPESYYESAWRAEFLRMNPTSKPEDLPPMTPDDRARQKTETASKIRLALTTMLMEVKPGEDHFPLIEVWDHPDLPESMAEEPSATELAVSWLASSWQTLAMFALAIAALLLVRGIGKSGSGDARPDFDEGFGLDLPKAPENEEPEGDDEMSPRLSITGQNLKEELTELVGTNPEVAANVLRRWLDSSAA